MPKKETKTQRELLFGLLLLSAATTTTTGAALASSTPPPIFNSTTTSTATATTNTSTLLYDRPNHGIQIRYPQDWAYIDSGNFLTGGQFGAVIFMPAMDALRFGMTPLQQQLLLRKWYLVLRLQF